MWNKQNSQKMHPLKVRPKQSETHHIQLNNLSFHSPRWAKDVEQLFNRLPHNFCSSNSEMSTLTGYISIPTVGAWD